MERLVPAFRATDRPRAAGGLRCRLGGIVAAVPKGPTDRVYGRQIEHIEAHAGHIVEAGLDVLERAVAARRWGGRTGGHLVPGAEARQGPGGDGLPLPGVAGGGGTVRGSRPQRGEPSRGAP